MKILVDIYPKFTVFTILPVMLLFTIVSGCDYPQWIDDSPVPQQNIQSPKSFIVGPEGGLFTALNGNVQIEIAKGTLTIPERFTIKVVEDYEGDFVIKGIEIKPRAIAFNIPARLRLRYDRQLSHGMDPVSAKSLVIYHFRNEADFDNRRPSDMIWINKCFVNGMDRCIETEIHSGGIFAIGEESLSRQIVGEPN